MANEQVFTNRTESYAKGRPGYASGVLDLLFDTIVKPNAQIADIGSGTGIFAKEFIERGFDVFCVEPNEEMRAQANSIFAGNPHFRSVAASAEATMLPPHSMDLVTAASALAAITAIPSRCASMNSARSFARISHLFVTV